MSGSNQRSRRPSGGSVADARAEAQAAAKARRSANAAALERHFENNPEGRGVVRAAVVVTAVFTILAVVAAGADTALARRVSALVDLGIFTAGLVLFMAALVAGARRSRFDEMTMAGWWFLSGSAPPPVRRALLGSLAVQCLVALGTASWRPFSALAFGVLVPTFGISICGWWGARYGYFPAIARRDAG